MNKYLLLRDNKQSGPYTVPELIAKGIKAYDLVWLEGKSAAWRYPGEIDELKDHAPLVEEQPFDRFYKKPEAESAHIPVNSVAADTHSRYQPTVSAPATEDSCNKRVYVNFPAKGTEPARPLSDKATMPPVQVRPPQFRDRTVSAPTHELIDPELPVTNTAFNSDLVQTANPRNPNQRSPFTRMAAIAAFVTAALFLYLFINWYQQRQSINELNAHIQQLQQRNNPTAQQQTASLVPAPAETESVPQPTPEQMVAEQAPAEPTVSSAPPVKRTTVTSNNNRQPQLSGESGVIFTEHKRTPSEEASAAPAPQGTSVAEPENLYDLVNVTANNYKTGVLGGISNLQLELNNSSTKVLQRVSVEIKYLGPEKRVVKTQTVQFQNVAAGSHVTLDVPKSNRGVTIEYAVVDIKS